MKLLSQLELPRCPHCGVDTPNMPVRTSFDTLDSEGKSKRVWRFYVCGRCGGVVTACAHMFDGPITLCYPEPRSVDSELPPRARGYLQQALDSLNAPSASIVMAASAVDAMLKARGYQAGSLYKRIDEATEAHVITPDVAAWAHEVRLDANDQRHADDDAPFPGREDAERCIEFATALGNILFTLPARVQRGIQAAKGSS